MKAVVKSEAHSGVDQAEVDVSEDVAVEVSFVSTSSGEDLSTGR